MTRVISISDDAYEELKKIKAAKSFSEVIIELVMEKKNDLLSDAIGSWSKETADKVKKIIYEDRKMPSRRFS